MFDYPRRHGQSSSCYTLLTFALLFPLLLAPRSFSSLIPAGSGVLALHMIGDGITVSSVRTPVGVEAEAPMAGGNDVY